MNYYNRIRSIVAMVYFGLFCTLLALIKYTNSNHAVLYIIAGLYVMFCASLVTCVFVEMRNRPRLYTNLDSPNMQTNIF